MKKWVMLIVALALTVFLMGCEEAETFDTADDAKAALNGQGVITIGGNFSEANQGSDIRVDGTFAGFLRESGLINTKWTISANYKDWFYAKYVTNEPVNNQEGVNSGSTIGFYDENDVCLGYAQEQVIGDDGYIVVFLNPDFSQTGLFASEDCRMLWDDTETVVAKGDVDWSYSSDFCTITIAPTGIRDVPFYAKFAMYATLYSDANNLKKL